MLSSHARLFQRPKASMRPKCASKPPQLMFSVADKRDGTMKDTLANIRATGEYTINIVNEPILRPMHKSADPLPPEESEFDHTGLTPTTSELIRAPGVLEAPITLELTVRDLIRIEDAGTTLVLGEVVLFHVDDAILKDGVVDAQLLGAVGRLGFNQYAIVRDVVDLSGA